MSESAFGVTGVDFVCIPANDFDGLLTFYGDVLGLERSALWQRSDEPPVGAEFETGGVTLALLNVAAIGQDPDGNALGLHHRYAPFNR